MRITTKINAITKNIIFIVGDKACILVGAFVDGEVLNYLKDEEYLMALDVYKNNILEYLENDFECLEYYYRHLKELHPIYIEVKVIEELE